ncbi:MAG: hypothetical protein ACLGPL_01810, partial [Acidobacteriota bacterium]
SLLAPEPKMNSGTTNFLRFNSKVRSPPFSFVWLMSDRPSASLALRYRYGFHETVSLLAFYYFKLERGIKKCVRVWKRKYKYGPEGTWNLDKKVPHDRFPVMGDL